MGNGFAFLDIILFAAIAAFLVLRLRKVLGRRTGHEQPPKYDPFAKHQSDESSEDKIIQLPDRAQHRDDEPSDEAELGAEAVPGGTPLEAALTQINLADSKFDPEGFVGGAKIAFEMIVNAFAAGETKVLRPLLSNDVYEEFAGEIKRRHDAKQTFDSTLIGISQAEIIEAELQAKTAFVTLKFISEQVNVTRSASGEPVEGDPNQVLSITDIWTFARNTHSRDPNWTLVATRSSN